MANKFCIQCGQQLNPGGHFCMHCGSPVGDSEGNAGAGDFRMIAPPPPSIRQAMPEPVFARDKSDSPQNDEEEEQCEEEDDAEDEEDDEDDEIGPTVITERALNYFLVCSYGNAPLDTNILLVKEKHASTEWKAASLVRDLKGIEIPIYAWLCFSIGEDWFGDFSLDEVDRDELTDDIINHLSFSRYRNLVQANIRFEPGSYEDLDRVPPGKWIKTVDERRGTEYKAKLHLPIPGQILKQKLDKHAGFIKDKIKYVRKLHEGEGAGVDKFVACYEETLEHLGKAKSLIPDGPVDHVYCRVSPCKDGVVMLEDEVNQEAGQGASSLRTPVAPRAEDNRSGTAARHELTRDPFQRPSDSKAIHAALDAIKRKYWPDS